MTPWQMVEAHWPLRNPEVGALREELCAVVGVIMAFEVLRQRSAPKARPRQDRSEPLLEVVLSILAIVLFFRHEFHGHPVDRTILAVCATVFLGRLITRVLRLVRA